MLIPTYERVGFHLRAPRVAVVFDAGADWQFNARHAMWAVSTRWGGAGFVLVAHRDGGVRDVLVEALQEYDPDFVVAAPSPTTLGDLGGDPPDVAGWSGEPALETTSTLNFDAARRLSRRTSVYTRRPELDDGQNRPWSEEPWDDCQLQMHNAPGSQLPGLEQLGVDVRICRAVPPTWNGAVATAAAVQVGAVGPPSRAGAAPPDEAALLRNVLGVRSGPLPADFLHVSTGVTLSMPPEQASSALQLTTHGLALVHTGARVRNTWVVGSDPEDLCLAMILDRTHGYARWIDPTWRPGAGPLGTAVREGLRLLRHNGGADVLSTTMSAADLTPWTSLLTNNDQERPTHKAGSPRPRRERRRTVHLAVEGQHDRRETIPLLHLRDGTIQLAASPPLPTTEPGHSIDTTTVPVQVDIRVPGATMPTRRGYDAHHMAGPDDEARFHTWIRSGRDGVTYQSHRFDLVLSGATQYGVLSTPDLRVPGLSAWVAQMAVQAGYSVRASGAGRATAVVAGLWGGRGALARAIDSPIRDMLATFTPPSQHQDSYLGGCAVRLAPGRGVLTFAGLRSAWPADKSDREVRTIVDDLTSRRVLRRGLVLRCPECRRLDFTAVDALAQHNVCDLCGAKIELAQHNWHLPVQEPAWFYDAHPTARDLIPTNSDVPLLLAAHLHRGRPRGAHVGEVELHRGRSVAETDLISVVDDVVVVGEAKANADLAAGGLLDDAIRKRILMAEVLRADQIVLATTRVEWPRATVRRFTELIAEASWFGAPPRLRVVTELRSELVRDTFV